jgi:hypothetical protein
LFGCKTTKQIDSSVILKQETKTVNVDSIVNFKLDSTIKKYQELIRTLDADIIFDNKCDTAYIDTGSIRVVNTVKYIPGKGFEASGNIKAFRLRESELLKALDSMSVQVEHEIRLREQAEQILKEEQIIIKLDKKTKVFNLRWLLFVGVAIGLFIGVKFKTPIQSLLTKLKSLFTKI